MTGDSFDRFQPQQRGRFGDNEYRSEQPERLKGGAKLHDLTLTLRNDKKPLAIAVTDPARRGSEWIWLPRSQIEIQSVTGTAIVVTVPEWLAKEKGLV